MDKMINCLAHLNLTFCGWKMQSIGIWLKKSGSVLIQTQMNWLSFNSYLLLKKWIRKLLIGSEKRKEMDKDLKSAKKVLLGLFEIERNVFSIFNEENRMKIKELES